MLYFLQGLTMGLDLVVHPHFGTDHNDGDALEGGEKFLPSAPREHQIQEDQVRGVLGQEILGLGAGIGPEDGIALLSEGLLQQIADGKIVLNDGNGLHAKHPFQNSAERKDQRSLPP